MLWRAERIDPSGSWAEFSASDSWCDLGQIICILWAMSFLSVTGWVWAGASLWHLQVQHSGPQWFHDKRYSWNELRGSNLLVSLTGPGGSLQFGLQLSFHRHLQSSLHLPLSSHPILFNMPSSFIHLKAGTYTCVYLDFYFKSSPICESFSSFQPGFHVTFSVKSS